MRKRYGQNFLINPDARRILLDALEIQRGQEIWEIGPGIGAMTAGLLERGARVTAFEIDPGFIQILNELFGADKNFSLTAGDVLKTWPQKTATGAVVPGLLGNLPYNIASVLLADFIRKKQFFSRMAVTVQLETARRLTAKPGTADFSSLTVLCSMFYKITPLVVLKGQSFYPEPRVNSQALRFDLLPNPKTPPVIFYPMLRSLFVSRRKTLQNNLVNFVSSVIIKEGAAASEVTALVFKRTGISGGRRAETLDNNEFILLAEVLEELTKSGNNSAPGI
ncbi:MAG: 16S rRNA (adenine(1518)-N(6)/adenine(1519)-N(6))-dimethyltransferase RsmA [Treponema sp.]|nr:16S rRNA (adenine(1518)-N(6)/adenine(1519)-N(6))-dimethyltransferase RsmA [Treponema sp.]